MKSKGIRNMSINVQAIDSTKTAIKVQGELQVIFNFIQGHSFGEFDIAVVEQDANNEIKNLANLI
jgi:hypothetical protein